MKHRLEIEGWIRVVLWCTIATIPLAVLVLVVAKATWVVVLPGLGVAVIAGAALFVILENIQRIHYQSRVGKACVRCAYDMRDNLEGTCPECGLERAAQVPYEIPASMLRRVGMLLGGVVVLGLLARFGIVWLPRL
ncbi:MAG TPA: hypothetical protein VD997_06855 [Phycisphaerales bacterium]|nr:hypothetical protein [Phycisphaerales bacterium]